MTRRLTAAFLAAFCMFGIPVSEAENWDVLSGKERLTLKKILAAWETWVPQKKAEGTAPMMTFEELYGGLGPEETAFLDRVRAIDPRKSFGFQGGFLGTGADGTAFKRIENQWIEKDGGREPIGPQYLPQNVYEVYERMMDAMEADLGKRLLIESGYRSPAYQLYTFLFYLPKHHYSLSETGRWVALPGYSEHGAPHQQAIDFVNEQGINGEDDPSEFTALPEYDWLMRRAHAFGFVLSYPPSAAGITFEPWHWSFRGSSSEEPPIQ